MIHRYSDRRDKPFVAVNCGSIPNDLQASEFFGVVKGAFTGAVADRKGHFETANEEPYSWMKLVICRIPCRFFFYVSFRKRSLIR